MARWPGNTRAAETYKWYRESRPGKRFWNLHVEELERLLHAGGGIVTLRDARSALGENVPDSLIRAALRAGGCHPLGRERYTHRKITAIYQQVSTPPGTQIGEKIRSASKGLIHIATKAPHRAKKGDKK